MRVINKLNQYLIIFKFNFDILFFRWFNRTYYDLHILKVIRILQIFVVVKCEYLILQKCGSLANELINWVHFIRCWCQRWLRLTLLTFEVIFGIFILLRDLKHFNVQLVDVIFDIIVVEELLGDLVLVNHRVVLDYDYAFF